MKDLGSAMEYMLCWNAGSDEIELVKWPDYVGLSMRYDCSSLACDCKISGMTEKELTGYLFIEAMHIIVGDKVPQYAVHNCLMQLKEYRNGVASDLRWIYSRSGERLEYIVLDD